MSRIYTVSIRVVAPHAIGESEIEAAINAALDDPPQFEDGWEVLGSEITAVWSDRFATSQ